MTPLSAHTPLLGYASRALTRSVRSPYMRSMQDVGRTLRLCISSCVTIGHGVSVIPTPWCPSLAHVEPDAVAALAAESVKTPGLYIGYAYSVHAPEALSVGGLASRSISPFVYCDPDKMFSFSVYSDALEWALASLSHTFKCVLMPKVGKHNG